MNFVLKLDEVLSKTPCSQCDGSGAYADYDGEPVQCQFCWQLRFTFIDNAKQALTSLIKELVAEARTDELKHLVNDDGVWHQDMTRKFPQKIRLEERIKELEKFEQNLLKEKEEV